MTDKYKEKFKLLFEKIKKVKHIEIYIAIGLALIIGIIYFSFVGGAKPKASSSTNSDIVSTNFSSSSEYINYLENKLENVITKINGAGDVKVIVSLEKGFEYVYATEEETRTTSNGTTITTSSIVMVNGKPVIKEEIYPVVGGIVVISSGADNINVKMNILSIIQTVIEVDNSKISIYKGN